MIAFLKGILFEVSHDSVLIDVKGIGFQVFLSTNDISQLYTKKNDEIFLHIYSQYKEDSVTLFGFLDKDTKSGFLDLIKVDGIGGKLALKILSFYDVKELFNHIENENIDSLKKITGVGPKMASKLIFHMKGKIPKYDDKTTNLERDLILSLTNLGYEEAIVREKIKKNKVETSNFEIEFKKLLKILSGKL